MIRKRDQLPEFEPPQKKLNTEKDILMKHLYAKQRVTKISLPKVLAEENKFEPSANIVSFASQHEGSASLAEILKINENTEEFQSLLNAGLNTSEIGIYQDYLSNSIEYVHQKHKAIDFDVLKQQIDNILDRISLYRNKSFELTSERNEVIVHPMNALKAEECKLMNNINCDKIDVTKLRRKAQKLQNRLNRVEIPKDMFRDTIESSIDVVGKNSQWDKTNNEDIMPAKQKSEKQYTCKEPNYYTICNNKIVKIEESNRFKITGRLSPKKLSEKYPKFANHDFGVPNKILYIKNFTGLKECDFGILFPSLRPLEIKIMQGKMRGQYFLTFRNETEASEALKILHCSLINDKPLIVQYARCK